MNTQDILRHGKTRLDTVIDISEQYDYELVDNVLGELNAVLDYSEYYDYELVEDIIGKVDALLDYSEFYDYTLGDNNLDYIYYETFVTLTKYILTEDMFVITTEDNYLLEYTD